MDALTASSDSTGKHDGNAWRRRWSTEATIDTKTSQRIKKRPTALTCSGSFLSI